MIYLDNAATGGFKPRAVTDAAENVMRYLCANPGRSGHRLSLTGANLVYSCREKIADLFGAFPQNVVFTKNCTEALNTAIFGTIKPEGKILTTPFEHNSVLRPLKKLKDLNLVDFEIVDSPSTELLPQAFEKRITESTYMIISTAVSNVTGEELPIRKIGKIAQKHNLLFLVDGAQGGGHIPINLTDDGISLLALAGHKALYGIMGSGILVVGDNISVSPLTYGGTGTDSLSLDQPSTLPESLESGTLNLPAISALSEGIRYVKKNMESFSAHIFSMTQKTVKELNKINGVTLYSKPNRSGIVAFNLDGYDSLELADVLSSEYDIAVRGGIHCAPLMHRRLGTENGGVVRISLSVQNTAQEIDFFIRAIKKIGTAR